jgi:hypothetical protein
MTINYALFPNHLTSDPDDYMARVQPTGTADLEEVIDRMVEKGSTVGRADILSVLEAYYATVEAMVLEGMNVNTPGANYGASIRGVFRTQSDSFDPTRHELRGRVSPGKRFRRAIRERGRASKQEPILPKPSLLSFTDLNSGSRNSVLTPGGMGQLVGHRLKFDPEDPAQGIFFRAAAGGETRVAVVGQNVPTGLIFMIPADLDAGDYTLEVRAVFGGDDLRAGALDSPLTVV